MVRRRKRKNAEPKAAASQAVHHRGSLSGLLARRVTFAWALLLVAASAVLSFVVHPY
ncbi:MAG: hypothetical protein IPK26_13210 [Planctomycetes bacterium]|nr:hypothetical protein [Planctomycetota bacterium]